MHLVSLNRYIDKSDFKVIENVRTWGKLGLHDLFIVIEKKVPGTSDYPMFETTYGYTKITQALVELYKPLRYEKGFNKYVKLVLTEVEEGYNMVLKTGAAKLVSLVVPKDDVNRLVA